MGQLSPDTCTHTTLLTGHSTQRLPRRDAYIAGIEVKTELSKGTDNRQLGQMLAPLDESCASGFLEPDV